MFTAILVKNKEQRAAAKRASDQEERVKLVFNLKTFVAHMKPNQENQACFSNFDCGMEYDSIKRITNYLKQSEIEYKQSNPDGGPIDNRGLSITLAISEDEFVAKLNSAFPDFPENADSGVRLEF